MSTVLTSVSKFVVCQLVYPIKIQLFCYQPKIDFGSHLVENTHKKKKTNIYSYQTSKCGTK